MMDPFGSNTNHDTLSLQEMIDCDIQAEFDGTEFTCPTRASTVLELPGDPSNSSMTTMDLDSDLMIGVNGARGSVTANTGHVQWMTAMDFDTPGLLVNPQTGLPIQPLYTCVSRPATSPAPADTPGAQTPASVNHRLLTEPTGADAAPSHSPGLHQVDSSDKKVFPKPAYSYSCLIAMALKNSKTGSLPVSEIYSFMTENFPYFKTAPNGWKNSVRHNLSLNKCFEKVEKPMGNSGQRKGCLWAMNPAKVGKMEEEVQKWGRKDPQAIKRSMARPENLELLEKGCLQGSFLQGQELRALAPGPCPSNPPLKLKGEPLDTDLGLIDTSLPLDTSLPDLNFQSDIWDELNDERLHFGISMATDIPSPSSVTMTTTSGTLIDCSASVSLSSSNLVQGSNYVCTSTTINNNNTSQSLVNHHNNNHKVELQQRNPSESNVVHGQIMCKNGRSLSAFM